MSDERTGEAIEPIEPAPKDPNREAAIASLSEGEELAECPNCLIQRRAFLIIEGKCDYCRTKDERAVFPAVSLGWPEVRQRRNILLADTDMTQIEDYPSEKKSAIRELRQQLRDVTQQPDPMAAWRKLDEIQRDINITR